MLMMVTVSVVGAPPPLGSIPVSIPIAIQTQTIASIIVVHREAFTPLPRWMKEISIHAHFT
jgi:hypothetical protein